MNHLHRHLEPLRVLKRGQHIPEHYRCEIQSMVYDYAIPNNLKYGMQPIEQLCKQLQDDLPVVAEYKDNCILIYYTKDKPKEHTDLPDIVVPNMLFTEDMKPYFDKVVAEDCFLDAMHQEGEPDTLKYYSKNLDQLQEIKDNREVTTGEPTALAGQILRLCSSRAAIDENLLNNFIEAYIKQTRDALEEVVEHGRAFVVAGYGCYPAGFKTYYTDEAIAENYCLEINRY